jgi:hypothetical protein
MVDKWWEYRMTSFSEKLAAAKTTARPTADVAVVLNNTLSERRAALDDELADALEIPADVRLASKSPQQIEIERIEQEIAAVDAEAAEALVTLRFTRMNPWAWAEVTAHCTMRPDVALDRKYGYNYQEVCRLVAPLSGARVEGEITVPLIVQEATDTTPAIDEWADLWDSISGHEVIRIVDTIFFLNEFEAENRIEQLKKALATRPASETNSN